jgi:hypothetical protein
MSFEPPTEPARYASRFDPCIWVEDDGTISASWGGSYCDSAILPSYDVLPNDETGLDEPTPSQLLDERLDSIRDVFAHYDAIGTVDSVDEGELLEALVRLVRPFFEEA